MSINRSSRTLLWIAAGISLVLGFFFLNDPLPDTRVHYSSEIGQTREVDLPDQTKVHLAANSKISYEPDGWESDRRIELEGKAYFDVSKKGSFIVRWDGGQVEVLGTRFEIHEFDKAIEVKCYEGQVSATIFKKSKVLLDSAEAFSYSNSKWKKKGVEFNMPRWIEGINQFRNTPLDQVIDILKSQYGVEFEFDERIDLSRSFTGSFPNDDLQLSLELVFGPFGISYQNKDGQIRLSVGGN